MIELLNNNTGVIAVGQCIIDIIGIFIAIIGLIIVIPQAIKAEKIINEKKAEKYKKELKKLLLTELWHNVKQIYQIEKSYHNQLNDLEKLHIPYYPPRTAVLEKFVNSEMLRGLNKDEKSRFIEIYAQLSDLKTEFFIWRENLLNWQGTDKESYNSFSLPILSYIEPAMGNILDLWVTIVKEIGEKSDIIEIQDLNKLIIEKIRSGKWIRTCYKSSQFNNEKYKNIEKFDIILCWEHDWKETDKEVIELKEILEI